MAFPVRRVRGAKTRLYSRLISPGDTVFDIGASYGWYAALFAKLVGRSGSVHAFEPVPEIASFAADTIALNCPDSVVMLNYSGLGREVGHFMIYTFADLPLGHASSSRLGRSDASPHECPITTLDEYVADKGVGTIRFMKVDVEGHERDVFLGGRATLSAPEAPIIAFEVNLDCLRGRGLTPASVKEPLLAYGYDHFWAIHPESGAQPVGGPTADVRTADYIAAKGEAVQLVEEAAASERASVGSR